MSVKGELLVLAALRIEATALRARGGPVVKTIGVGPTRAARQVPALLESGARSFVLAGLGGALDDRLSPGDLVVATEVQSPDAPPFSCVHQPLADALRAEGLPVTVAPIASRDHLVVGAERAEAGRDGARVVEMESLALRALAEARPFSVVRVVIDTPSRELGNLMHTAVGGLGAMRALRRVGAAIRDHQEAL